MCGRFSLRTTGGKIVPGLDVVIPAMRPRYSVSPITQSPEGEGVIVRMGEDGKLFATIAKWGFLPGHMKDEKWRQSIARSEGSKGEGIDAMRMFGSAFRKQRCLVIVDGFFEWNQDTKPKQPYFVQRKDGQAFAIAGIWASRTDEGGKLEENFAIITVEPNEQMKPIHKRMPVIMDQKDYLTWLDPKAEVSILKALLRPYPDPILDAYKVSTRVNNPNSDDPDCITPK
jgi:putative SOS response-associated peptidase YedK